MKLELLDFEHQDLFLEFVRESAEIFGHAEWNSASFKKFVVSCDKERMDWRPKAGKISVSHYIFIIDNCIRGYGRLRFPIDPSGDLGNLEFFVPSSMRGRGYGTYTLNKLLFEAVRAGLARALVVCKNGDPAAIRCIEQNRGEIADQLGDKSRYWIRFR